MDARVGGGACRLHGVPADAARRPPGGHGRRRAGQHDPLVHRRRSVPLGRLASGTATPPDPGAAADRVDVGRHGRELCGARAATTGRSGALLAHRGLSPDAGRISGHSRRVARLPAGAGAAWRAIGAGHRCRRGHRWLRAPQLDTRHPNERQHRQRRHSADRNPGLRSGTAGDDWRIERGHRAGTRGAVEARVLVVHRWSGPVPAGRLFRATARRRLDWRLGRGPLLLPGRAADACRLPVDPHRSDDPGRGPRRPIMAPRPESDSPGDAAYRRGRLDRGPHGRTGDQGAAAGRGARRHRAPARCSPAALGAPHGAARPRRGHARAAPAVGPTQGHRPARWRYRPRVQQPDGPRRRQHRARRSVTTARGRGA